MGADETNRLKVLHVSNISVAANKDQIYSLFQFVGKVEEFKVYPSDANTTSTTIQKYAFVRFDDSRCVEVGQHLTNTVLIDRAIVCIPWLQETIPDESTFLNSGGSLAAGQRQLPPHVTNKVQDVGDGTSVLLTVDPTLEQLGLTAYPPLPGDTDLGKVEEIRRTIYIGNLPKGIDGEAVMNFFNNYVGEVMYVRMAKGPDTLPCAYAYVEFSNQTSIPTALQNNGIDFQGRPLRIQHSRVAIIKPQQKTTEQALEEVEEAILKNKNGISGRSRSRSPRRRSPERRRTRSPRSSRRSRSPRSTRRSRSKSRDRGGSRRKSRSRERDRKRSRSRDRDRDRRRRSRSRSAERKRSRSRSKDRKKSRSRSRDRKRDRKDRKRSRSRERRRTRSRSRDRKRERRDRSRSAEKKSSRESKENKKEETEEEKLRKKLLEKTAARNGAGDDSGSESEWVEKKEKTPSKIKNERKRHVSSDDD